MDRVRKASGLLVIVMGVAAYVLGDWIVSLLAGPAGEAKELAAVVREVKDVMSELRKEQGVTIGYTQSKGMRYRRELDAQRRRTDERLLALDEAIAAAPPVLRSAHKELLEWRKTRREERELIDILGLSSQQVIDLMAVGNEALLSIVMTVGRVLGDAETDGRIEGFENLQRAIAHATIESDFAHYVFDDGRFPTREVLRFVGDQERNVTAFLQSAGSYEKEVYESALTRRLADSARAARALAIGQAEKGRIDRDALDTWRRAQGDYVDRLNQLATITADNIHSRCVLLETAAREAAFRKVAAGGGIIAFLAIAGYFLLPVSRKEVRETLAAPGYEAPGAALNPSELAANRTMIAYNSRGGHVDVDDGHTVLAFNPRIPAAKSEPAPVRAPVQAVRGAKSLQEALAVRCQVYEGVEQPSSSASKKIHALLENYEKLLEEQRKNHLH